MPDSHDLTLNIDGFSDAEQLDMIVQFVEKVNIYLDACKARLLELQNSRREISVPAREMPPNIADLVRSDPHVKLLSHLRQKEQDAIVAEVRQTIKLHTTRDYIRFEQDALSGCETRLRALRAQLCFKDTPD